MLPISRIGSDSGNGLRAENMGKTAKDRVASSEDDHTGRILLRQQLQTFSSLQTDRPERRPHLEAKH